MDHNTIIKRQVSALESLEKSLTPLFKDAISHERLTYIIDKDLFSPSENEEMAYWFARFVTIRHNLWSIVETGISSTGGIGKVCETHDYQYFVLGYSAVCSLIRMDQFLIKKVAYHPLIQRKLNEALPEHRVERKQFHYIQKAVTQPSNAIRIHQAHRLLKKKYNKVQIAVINTPVERVFQQLTQKERYINLSRRQYFGAWLRSRQLNWRRRGASAKRKSLFSILEYSGRLAAELSLPRPKKVNASIRAEVKKILQPGDFFVTRHSKALTNLFLPGYWPHVAFYIGTESERAQLNIKCSDENAALWSGDNCTFEALKDGVHFRPLSETLNVDAFVIIRPNFSTEQKGLAISRVIKHAGKGYNFDFDFFSSDQLVCTEVIYRAYDGINEQSIPLIERMGRKTLSAQDLLDLALDTEWAEPIAIFGTRESKSNLHCDANVVEILKKSYRET